MGYCPTNRDEFECKPDECVKWSLVCDGVAHCSNRADEDCGNIKTTNTYIQKLYKYIQTIS